MNSFLTFLVICVFFTMPMMATAQSDDSAASREERMQWWREARFGMFIHWGIYSILAGEWEGRTDYGEWIRNNAQIPIDTYDTLRHHFNPLHFDADAWVSMAKQSGMKYIVLTSKHHDGFCLFDSRETNFDVMSTPFKRDIVRELADACRRQGIVFGLYHSIMDWHHPDYLPRRVWEKDRSDDGAEYDRYVSYMKGQIKELLTNYGPIGILWFDGEWESTWTEKYGTDMYAYVRSLQPNIIVNNRVGAAREGMTGTTAVGKFGGDFGTPEQQVPATGMPGVDWESCMTMNENWGFNRADTNFKSTTEILRTLIDIASKGGNYLLNVGPKADGTFPQESIERLSGIGEWMRVNGGSIYGTSASPFQAFPWGRSTQRVTASGTTVYLHVFDRPDDGKLIVPGLRTIPKRVSVIGDDSGRSLRTSHREDALMIDVPRVPVSAVATVIALEFDSIPEIYRAPELISDLSIFIDTLSVAAHPHHENVVIRYTLDGSIPSSSSPVTSGRIMVTEGVTVSVRSFLGDVPVSPTSSAEFQKVIPRRSSPVTGLTPGLSYAYYEGEWDKLPDFRDLTPVKTGVVDSFTFFPRDEVERFAFVYRGFAEIPATGVYTFFLSSDDGSRLWVQDTLVVDNDGLHGMRERSGSVALSRGYHTVRIEYFERTGSDALDVQVIGPGLKKGTLLRLMLR